MQNCFLFSGSIESYLFDNIFCYNNNVNGNDVLGYVFDLHISNYSRKIQILYDRYIIIGI